MQKNAKTFRKRQTTIFELIKELINFFNLIFYCVIFL